MTIGNLINLIPSGTTKALAAFIACIIITPSALASSSAASSATNEELAELCGVPTMDALKQYKVQPGDTLANIATKHKLTTATLMGFNPSIRNGRVKVGQTISIPPFDGIAHHVGNEENYKTIAKKYGVKPGVLFERNGCHQKPKVVFVPGVAWKPNPVLPQVPSFAPGELPIFNVGGYPLPYSVPVTSRYGWRSHPVTGSWAFHSGIDLGAPKGTPVLATKNGKVSFAGWSGGYGNLVELGHSEFGTRYAHLSAIYVQSGQNVVKGQQIGLVGSTGRSTGPHLHFEVLAPSINGWAAIDPAPYLGQLALVVGGIMPA